MNDREILCSAMHESLVYFYLFVLTSWVILGVKRCKKILIKKKKLWTAVINGRFISFMDRLTIPPVINDYV